MAEQKIEARALVRTARSKIQTVASILRANDCEEWAKYLEERLADMDSWYNAKEALFQIGQVCHAKALGDLYVREFDWNQWVAEIADLKLACARAFEELESSGGSDL